MWIILLRCDVFCDLQRLWEYVIHDSHLKEVLNKIKDIQLLGRGDLYSALIESADVLLSCPPTPLTNHGKFQ